MKREKRPIIHSELYLALSVGCKLGSEFIERPIISLPLEYLAILFCIVTFLSMMREAHHKEPDTSGIHILEDTSKTDYPAFCFTSLDHDSYRIKIYVKEYNAITNTLPIVPLYLGEDLYMDWAVGPVFYNNTLLVLSEDYTLYYSENKIKFITEELKLGDIVETIIMLRR